MITSLETPLKLRWRHALLPLALVATTSAQAVEYTRIQPEKSTIAFTYQQMGVKVDGRFQKFSAQLNFDPAKPAAAKASIDIDLGSIDAGSPDADQEVVGKPWLNVKAFPTARFVSGSVKALGANRFEIAGKLTIKGQTQDVVVPATFTAQGNAGAFDGTLTIRRGDFALGEGAWAKFDIVANDVVVKFHLTAASGK